MLSSVAIIPCAPVLVPELAGLAAVEMGDMLAAVLAAAAVLPERWVVVGTGPPSEQADRAIGPGAGGTFAGFGVDLPVWLSAAAPVCPPIDLPVCALVAAWVRGQVRPEASAQVRVYGHDHGAIAALALGRELRAELDRMPDPVGVLVVADGANTLTHGAPGGYHPEHADAQLALDDALAKGDVAALAALPEQISGRVAFQVLAGLAEPGPRCAKELHRAAPFGVGYFAGVWQL